MLWNHLKRKFTGSLQEMLVDGSDIPNYAEETAAHVLHSKWRTYYYYLKSEANDLEEGWKCEELNPQKDKAL